MTKPSEWAVGEARNLLIIKEIKATIHELAGYQCYGIEESVERVAIALDRARNEALDEAAKVADMGYYPDAIATAIRNLKGQDK